MTEPTILRGSDHFFTNLYEGNGGGQRVGNFVPFTDNGTIAKSCIFDSASNVSLTRTPGSASNRKTFTISFWVKRGRLGDSGSNVYGQRIFFVGPSGTQFFDVKFAGSGDTGETNSLHIRAYTASAEQIRYYTNRTFEDTSKWYHIVIQIDTTQSTSSDRVKLYVDGDQVTSWQTSSAPSQDYDTQVNATEVHNIGRFTGYTTNNLDAYLAEFNFIDGSIVDPSTFGLTDTSTGRWIPKTLTGITYGTNGFRMQFANSAGQTIGDDTSGNTNDYAVSNIATTDITTDSPTQNHMTFDPLRLNDWTLSEGNLTCVGTPNSGAGRHSLSNMIMPKSGKYYFEMTVDVNNDSPRYFGLAKADASVTEGTTANVLPRVVVTRNGGTSDGHFISDGTSSSANGFATTSGTVINFALDADNEKLYVGKDGSYYDFEGGSGNPTNGTGATFSNIYKTIDWRAINMSFSTGTGGTSHKVTWNFGGKTFAHTAPTGFSALQQDNFPETGKGITGLTWIKDRDNTYSHGLRDSSRGRHKDIFSNLTQDEVTNTDGVQKFLKGGIQIEDLTGLNASGADIVSWNWVANGGTTASNGNGSINSTVQVNTTAGFSIVQYTGTGSAATVGHGLSSAPEWFIVKELGNANGWIVSHKGLTSQATYSVNLSNSNAEYSDAGTYYWNSTAPTSSVFSIATDSAVNRSSGTYVAYCWHGVAGYSKFSKWTGNGSSSNGPFVYTGFKPSWVMWKATDGEGWYIYDTKRNTYNGQGFLLRPDVTNADYNYGISEGIIALSNGFKVYGNSGWHNTSGQDYIYMAFAEHPFAGTSSINPVTAR